MTSATKSKSSSRQKTGPTPKRDARTKSREVVEAASAPEKAARTTPDWRKGGFFAWLGCIVVALIHTGFAVGISSSGGGETLTLVAVLIPAIVTAIAIPGARRRGWHRWVALVMLTYTTIPWYAASVLAIGETWVLHRFWAVDFPDNPVSRAVSRVKSRTSSRQK